MVKNIIKRHRVLESKNNSKPINSIKPPIVVEGNLTKEVTADGVKNKNKNGKKIKKNE
jgi:hypothetical protein